MNNKSILLLIALAPVATSVRAGEGSAILDGGWRLSVGAGYDSGVKSNFRFTPHSTYATPLRMRVGTLDQETAEKYGWGDTVDGKTTYTNVEKNKSSWTKDNRDLPVGNDRDANSLEDYRFGVDKEFRDTGKTYIGDAAYDRVDSAAVADDALAFSDSDDSAMPSVHVELSRNLYYNPDYHFGAELAFAFQYARRNNIFGAHDCRVSGSSSLMTGRYQTEVELKPDGSDSLTELLDFYKDIWGNYDTIGKNDEGNPTPEGLNVKKLPQSRESMVETEVATDTGYCMTTAHGDYEDIEMMLLLRPYYDIFDWLRLNVMGGLVVSRQDLDFSMSILQAESNYHLSRDYSQWDVYGVAGGGLMLRRWDFTLSADFLARFLDDDMTVNNRYVQGNVERGRWMFRLALGYEF